jgi:hypothetical protein
MNALYTRMMPDIFHQGIITCNGEFLSIDGPVRLAFLDVDMTPETEDLLTDRFLETIGQ